MSNLGNEYLRLQEDLRTVESPQNTAPAWAIRRVVAQKTSRMEQINVQLNYMVRTLARATGMSFRQVIMRQAAAVGRRYQRDRRYQIWGQQPLHMMHRYPYRGVPAWAALEWNADHEL
jgi:hypothetical protein